MAKGARASSNKKNKAALKDKVFGPIEQARAERLNAKLTELAAQPKPSESSEINIVNAPSITATTDANGDSQMANGGVTGRKEKRKKPFVRKGIQKSGSWLQEARAAKKIRKEEKQRKKEKNKIAFRQKKRAKKAAKQSSKTQAVSA